MKVTTEHTGLSRTFEVENEGVTYHLTVYFNTKGKIIDQEFEEEDVSEETEEAIMNFLEANGYFD